MPDPHSTPVSEPERVLICFCRYHRGQIVHESAPHAEQAQAFAPVPDQPEGTKTSVRAGDESAARTKRPPEPLTEKGGSPAPDEGSPGDLRHSPDQPVSGERLTAKFHWEVGSYVPYDEAVSELQALQRDAAERVLRLTERALAAEQELEKARAALRYDDADRAEDNYLPASVVARESERANRAEAERDEARRALEAEAEFAAKAAVDAERAAQRYEANSGKSDLWNVGATGAFRVMANRLRSALANTEESGSDG